MAKHSFHFSKVISFSVFLQHKLGSIVYNEQLNQSGLHQKNINIYMNMGLAKQVQSL